MSVRHLYGNSNLYFTGSVIASLFSISLLSLLITLSACALLNELINETVFSHKPVIIAGEKSNAVLLSEEDWESVQETLYLLSIPNMRESIREGLSTPTEECAKELDW